MTQLHQVQSHPASVDAYIRNGWSLVPIPPGTKGPRHDNWNQKTAALHSQAELPHGWGIGLAHAYSGTMALDIDEWHKASEELIPRGVDIRGLYEASDAVVIDSGRAGHGKLLFAMPFGLSLPSKKIVRDGQTLYELRCATSNGLTVQDVLPPSIHPSTRQPYRWAGRGNWMRLPTIPQALLDLWQSMLVQEKVAVKTGDATASWDDIEEAMKHISADCDRKQWIEVGMALHGAGVRTGEIDHALSLWNEWSKQSTTKYPGEREIMGQWKSFRDDKGVSIGLGTLFHLARGNGYVRAMPDASSFFSAVNLPATPDKVVTELKVSPPDLDINLFPRVLSTRAMEISTHVGCDPLVPLFAGLSAVCGAIDARSRLELDHGFKVPPILWIMTIGEPGDKKTPGSKPMFEILKQLEAEDNPRFAKALRDFEVNEVRYAAAYKHNLDANVTPEAILSGTIEQHPLPPEPVKPVPCRIVVQDITSQKLVRHCADRPQGLLCYLDEMASWMSKLSDVRSVEDKSAWTVAYEANRYEMDRVGTGTISASNYAVSVYGNVQPRVFNEHIGILARDGLVQRFIPVPLRPEHTRLGDPVPEYMTNTAEYEQMVRVAYGMPAVTYRLSEPAWQLYRAFQTKYHQTMVDERLVKSGDTFMTALGKLEGLAGRLIFLFHVIESPFDTHVSADVVQRVIKIMRSYIVPVFRHVYDASSDAAKFDAWVADYIVQYCDQETITLSQIKRSARRQLEKVSPWIGIQMVVGAMSVLEESKWVARMDDGSQETRGTAQWAINPALKETFKAHRLAVIAAKQRRLEEIYELEPQYEKYRGAPKKVKGHELLQEKRK